MIELNENELIKDIRSVKFINLSGRKYGKLNVIRYAGWKINKGHKRYYYYVMCDCGKKGFIDKRYFDNVKSCGCLKIKENSISKTKEYRAWSSMIHRCCNPKNPSYFRYGGRGITVCEEWKQYDNFLKDMGKSPTSNHSLDRIDNNKGYFKENCRWATVEEQNNNTRQTRYITYNGITKSAKQWSIFFNIDYQKLINGLCYGWTFEQMLKKLEKKAV